MDNFFRQNLLEFYQIVSYSEVAREAPGKQDAAKVPA